MYEIRHAKGYVEVFHDGVFQFSADTIREAKSEVQKIVKSAAKPPAVSAMNQQSKQAG